ncbi:MAG: ribonuclease P protein component [Candidatus Paceibacterota bacterium]
MLPKKERLDRAQFSRVFASGRRIHGVYTTVILSPAPTFTSSVVVPKKVAKLAHERNRIRRRIYALLRKMRLDLDPKVALIVVTKPAISKLTRAEFVSQVATEIGRALNKR